MPNLFPLQLLLTTFAGWVNPHQAQAIDYLIEENRVLKSNSAANASDGPTTNADG